MAKSKISLKNKKHLLAKKAINTVESPSPTLKKLNALNRLIRELSGS